MTSAPSQRVPRQIVPTLVICCAALSGSPAQAQSDTPQQAGLIKRVTGAVVLTRGSASVIALPGHQVLVGDTLRTGPGGGVAVSLKDDTLMSVGADSELQVTAFSFDSTTQSGNLLASVWRGTAAFISGLIAQRSPENMRVQTRSVVLGVRGTEFIVDAGRSTP